MEVRGQLFGPGTPWRVGGLDRWSSRTVRADDTDREASHGAILGRDLINAQVRGLQLNTGHGNGVTDPIELVGLRDDVREAWATEAVDVPIVYQLGGQKRLRWGRTRDIDLDENQITVGYMTADLEFLDRDGVEYSAVEHVTSTPPETPGAGFAVPFTPPFSLPAGVVGSFDATNAGRVPGPWTARILGPTNTLSPPFVEHLGTGESLDFSANGGLEIPAGSWVDLDSSNRSVRLGGVTDRRLNLSTFSRWFSLAPGINQIRFAGSGTLEFRWRDTW